MDKMKASGLRKPNTMLPLPSRFKATNSRVLQPLHNNKANEEPVRLPAARKLLRRSKSVSDLRTHIKLTEPLLNRKPLAAGIGSTSKHLLSSTSTTNMHNPARKQEAVKTKPTATATRGTTLKRTAANAEDNAATKPKVSKPAKPAPYDYKARFNLLNEKHLCLVETHKQTKQKLVEVENDLNDYQQLKEKNYNLQRDKASMFDENIKLELEHKQALSSLSEIKSEFGRLNCEHDSLKADYNALKTYSTQNETKIKNLEQEKSTLTNNLESLTARNESLQSDFSSLQSAHEKLGEDNKRLQEINNCLQTELNDANNLNRSLSSELHEYKTCLQSHEELRRAMHNQIQDLKGTIRVFCRVRPPLYPQENDKMLCNISCIDEGTLEIKKCKESINAISGRANDLKLEFNFDKVFPAEATQTEVFEELAQLIQSALDGYHVCVFAYGQTGSGKTYTMQGEPDPKYLGMIPRTIDLIFNNINNLSKVGWAYAVEASFLEIYNENIKDLLDKNTKEHLEIRYNEGRGTTVTNLSIMTVESATELKQLMTLANRNRAVATTNFNEHSSRSHAVTKITLTGFNEEMNISYTGSLSLVDLAGSENAKTSTTERMTETKNINKSLSTLGTVMAALHNKENHIPYRNSKLTYLLQSSLGGNSKTLMFVNVAPFEECYNESISSLRFASKVKEVKIGSRRNKAYLQRELSNM